MDAENMYRKCHALARRKTQIEFLKKYPGYYLLGEVPSRDFDVEPAFDTSVTSVERLRSIMALDEPEDNEKKKELDTLKPGPFVVKVQKKTENSWMIWTSVGRARNNDVVLRHSSVSKLHARIYTEDPEEQGQALLTQYWISDTGSSLGTWINGRLLDRAEPSMLNIGDQLKLGEIECYFLDALSMHTKLHDLFSIPPIP